jgi:hypothetical protein
MGTKALVAAASALSAIAVAGCGGHSLPRTPANVDVCRVYVQVRIHKAPLSELTGATLGTNAAISHQLRQDLLNYIALTFQNMSGAAQAMSKADADCASIGV